MPEMNTEEAAEDKKLYCSHCGDQVGVTDDEVYYYIKYSITDKRYMPHTHIIHFGPFCHRHKPVGIELEDWSGNKGIKMLEEIFGESFQCPPNEESEDDPAKPNKGL